MPFRTQPCGDNANDGAKEHLTRVASMNSTLDGVLRFVAPPLGALLLELINVQGILPLDVLTALVAILPLFFIAVPSPAPRWEGAPRRSCAASARDCATSRDWPALRVIMIAGAMWGVFASPVMSFMPLFVKDYLGGGALELGWIQAAARGAA